MIKVDGISKSFGIKVIFNDFSLEINENDFIVVSGVSGCGKTTLLNIIGSLEPVDSGKVIVDGKDISKKSNQIEYLRDKAGFLFQNFALIENKSVFDNLNIVQKGSRSGTSFEEALESVGLADKINQKVYSLSGGEQQRVALVRLMIKKCKYIITDEPTASLDRKNAQAVVSILKQLNSMGKAIILATHDEELKKEGKRLIEL